MVSALGTKTLYKVCKSNPEKNCGDYQKSTTVKGNPIMKYSGDG
jgi:hypothetical protein